MGWGKKGGGIVVCVNENLCANRRFDLEVPEFEALWIQLRDLSEKGDLWYILCATQQ